MEPIMTKIITEQDWRMRPYYASFKLLSLTPVRHRSIVLPALSEEDARLSIIRFSTLIGWQVHITEDPVMLVEGLFEGAFVCPHPIDYDLWSPLHYDNLAWRPKGVPKPSREGEPLEGRGAHVIIV